MLECQCAHMSRECFTPIEHRTYKVMAARTAPPTIEQSNIVIAQDSIAPHSYQQLLGVGIVVAILAQAISSPITSRCQCLLKSYLSISSMSMRPSTLIMGRLLVCILSAISQFTFC